MHGTKKVHFSVNSKARPSTNNRSRQTRRKCVSSDQLTSHLHVNIKATKEATPKLVLQDISIVRSRLRSRRRWKDLRRLSVFGRPGRRGLLATAGYNVSFALDCHPDASSREKWDKATARKQHHFFTASFRKRPTQEEIILPPHRTSVIFGNAQLLYLPYSQARCKTRDDYFFVTPSRLPRTVEVAQTRQQKRFSKPSSQRQCTQRCCNDM